MKIKREKDKLKRQLNVLNIFWSLGISLGVILVVFLIKLIIIDKGFDGFWWFWGLISFGIIYVISRICISAYVGSLEYEINEEENVLIKKYQIIGKKTDTARLQIINSVDINQGIIEKICGIFSVHVCYGIGMEGYDFNFRGLTEELSNKIIQKIKPYKKGIELK